MRAIFVLTVALFACAPTATLAQQSSAAKVPHPTMTFPKGWVRVKGDDIATIVYRSPSAPQDLRYAPLRRDDHFTIDSAIQKTRKILTRIPFLVADVTKIAVCNGRQPAVFGSQRYARGGTFMETVIVMGHTGGALITYNLLDGRPDPKAEASMRSICVP